MYNVCFSVFSEFMNYMPLVDSLENADDTEW